MMQFRRGLSIWFSADGIEIIPYFQQIHLLSMALWITLSFMYIIIKDEGMDTYITYFT